MKKNALSRFAVAAVICLFAGKGAIWAQAAVPVPENEANGDQILRMLEEDLAAGKNTKLSEDDAEHIRRLKRLHELRAESLVNEAAGAAAGAGNEAPTPELSPESSAARAAIEAAGGGIADSDTEQMVWDHDIEIQQMWKEIAELRRSISGGPVEQRTQPSEPQPRPGIDEPLPYDPQLDAQPGEEDENEPAIEQPDELQ